MGPCLDAEAPETSLGIHEQLAPVRRHRHRGAWPGDRHQREDGQRQRHARGGGRPGGRPVGRRAGGPRGRAPRLSAAISARRGDHSDLSDPGGPAPKIVRRRPADRGLVRRPHGPDHPRLGHVERWRHGVDHRPHHQHRRGRRGQDQGAGGQRRPRRPQRHASAPRHGQPANRRGRQAWPGEHHRPQRRRPGTPAGRLRVRRHRHPRLSWGPRGGPRRDGRPFGSAHRLAGEVPSPSRRPLAMDARCRTEA